MEYRSLSVGHRPPFATAKRVASQGMLSLNVALETVRRLKKINSRNHNIPAGI
jgi:hypothetical protein